MGIHYEPDTMSTDSAARKNDLIHIRVSAATKAILNWTATLRGQKLSEFMLESARIRAEEPVLAQRMFVLGDDVYKHFIAVPDAPAKPDRALQARIKRKPVWGALSADSQSVPRMLAPSAYVMPAL
jgi:uncharacterized protein (DUF1778 family)